MNMWHQYEKIQAFKQDARATIDGINYARVIALYLYDGSVKHLIKIIGFSFLFAPKTILTATDREALNFYSYRYKRRADYDYMSAHLGEIAGERCDSAEVVERLSPTQWARTLRYLSCGWTASAGLQSSTSLRIGTAVLIAKYRSAAQHSFQHLTRGRKCLITFCDAAPHDNLVTQIARARGVLTVTAQHGQYRVLDPTNISIDAEAYANFVSDRMLCWGEATCAEFERFGIERNRLFITGWIRRWEPAALPESTTGVFGVMLNGANGAESNLNMLDAAAIIATSLDMNFVVRLHPSFAPDHYAERAGIRCLGLSVIPSAEYIHQVDFSIAHMSGATIEMLHANSPVYVLDDGHLANAFRIPGLSFESVDSILAAIREDASTADGGRYRRMQLRSWFNDDTDQDARIYVGIFGGE